MLTQPMIGKTTGHAAARHGRGPEDAGTRSGSQRAELPGTTLAADRSTMELARESGAGAKTESGKTARTGLRGGHRYRAARGLDKTVVRALAKDSAWVRNHENIFVIGPCGVGKSFIVWRWPRKPVATATRPSICGWPPCCGIWPWPESTAAYASFWHG